MTPAVFILPGLFNSGDGHWQTVWEQSLPNARRVQQAEWNAPNRADWVETLDAAIASSDGPVVLAAHSLGCALTAWWASERGHAPHAAKVRGALLVAPPDVERADFPAFVTGFAPMPSIGLSFPAAVIASSNDPWCALPRARAWAEGWDAVFHDIGAHGHINGDSGLGDWRQGREWLDNLVSSRSGGKFSV